MVKHLLCYLAMCATVLAQVPDTLKPQLEEARKASYAYWGYHLPEQPVWFPFVLDPALMGNAGMTNLAFTNSEVVVTEMRVSAKSNMAEVLPHEMDHVVRATIVRRPIPRWIDEGCSSQFEVGGDWPATITAAHSARQWIDESVLDMMEYPENKKRNDELYGFGHTAVQCLLRRNTPKTLIAFQVDNRPVAQKLPDYYGMTATEFIQVWRTEVVMPEYCDTRIRYVPYPIQYPAVQRKPLLEVWGASWCGPCVAFKRDYSNDPTFRAALDAQYHIHFRTWDNPFLGLEKTLKGIDKVPTFLIPSQKHRVVGYTTKEKLLAELIPATPYVRQEPPAPPAIAIEPPVSSAPPTTVIEPDEFPFPSERFPAIIPPTKQPNGGYVLPIPPPPPPVTVPPVDSSTPALEAPRMPPVASETQDDPKYVPTPPNASTGQPEASTGPLRWGLGKIWDNKLLLIGGALVATGFGGGLGGYLIKSWGMKKVGSVVAHIGGTQTPPTCATAPYIPQPVTPPIIKCPLTQGRQEVSQNTVPAPFPRKLDEARQLFALQGTEGRVAVLDAIRGMFLDAEMEKALENANTPEGKRMLLNLKNAIDSRVDEVAPLTTKV